MFRKLVIGCVLIACAGAFHEASAQVTPPSAGTSLAAFIETLRETGLTIVTSSELVPESLRIVESPSAGDPLEQLRVVLAPHGLDLVAGPRQSWLVVRRALPEAPPAPPPLVPEVRPPALETIIVSASRYALSRDASSSVERIDRLQLDLAPKLGDDALRATHALPGITSSGLTARTNVRGGASDETLYLLDGVRLYDPFHLKDFESLFSVLSPRMIEQIDVHTGGYPARYGDRSSGVVDMRTVEPTERRHYELGVSTLTSSFQSSGRFAEDRGSWLTSIRRGNLDLLIDAAGSDIGTPQYTDFFSKLDFDLGGGRTIGGGVLSMDDDISLFDQELSAATAEHDDTYSWLRFEHAPTERLEGRYLLSHANLDAQRDGRIDEPNVTRGALTDRRGFDVDLLDAEWGFTLDERHYFEWGLQLGRSSARYSFESTREIPYPIHVVGLETTGNQVATDVAFDQHSEALFANYRWRSTDRIVFDFGLRWDRQSYPDDEQLSPRLGMRFDIGERTTLRASLGRFYQSQNLNELEVADGRTELMPAQRADHGILSVEHLFNERLMLRAELYDKRFDRVGVRFENLFERVSLLPELAPDRVVIAPTQARARGLELALEVDANPWRWWLSLTRSSVEDLLDTGWARRGWEEPWSGKGGLIWVGGRWSASATVTVRSGWPISPLRLETGQLVVDDYNGVAFETFESIDVRIARTIAVKRGTFELSLTLNNALNAENECCFDYTVETDAMGQLIGLSTDTNHWLPIVPSFGFLWSFDTSK